MQVTRRQIEAYLDCRYKAYLLASARSGDPHDLELVQAELQATYRQRAVDDLVRRCVKSPEVVASASTNIDIHSGPPLVLGALLEDEELAFHFDALRRVDGKSSLGPFHYTPVLFWHGESLGRNLTLLLAVGGLVLARHQDVQPKAGTVLFGDECKARTIQLTNHYKLAQQVLDGLLANEAPRLILNDHCGLCEFRDQCREQAIKTDDLSLLGHMTAKKIDHYAQTGTLTVTQLSYTFHARRHRNVHPKQNPRSLPLHALAIRQKRILVVGKPAFPKTAVRIFFDAEGDFDRKFTYLLGLLMVKDGHEEMVSLWADDPSQQKRLFEQFVDVLRQHDGYTLFHYGQYELEILRKMRTMVRPKKAVDAAIAASVNVLAPLHSDVYFPTYSNGLKDIGKCLGFSWTDPSASGLQSLAWRKRWEMTGPDEFKQKLIVYNSEDCRALKQLTETLEAIGNSDVLLPSDSTASWEEVTFKPTKRQWGKIGFVLPDFDHINRCAYFNYQRDKLFLRCGTRWPPQQRTRKRRHIRRLRPNARVEITASRCPCCRSYSVVRLEKHVRKKQVFDLEIRPSGMVRRVIEYSAVRVRCLRCNRVSLPAKFQRLDPHRHGLKSWAMYQHVQHQVSLRKLAALCEEFFHLPLSQPYVHRWKALLSQYYRSTTKLVMAGLLAGTVIYIDETEITLKHGKGYVWVLANHQEVIYILRPNREASFLKEMLAGYRGVIVSDFYSGYDGLPCLQQKCLVHLIRDMNSDLRTNAFDDELKAMMGEFGKLMREIVETIDRHGLKKERLEKHKPTMNAFLDRLCAREYRSQVAQGYKERFARYRDRLFTFLDYDGVSWNNNYAEHAIKQFAQYRALIDGDIEESGLKDFLTLLSVCVTCKYKSVSFLQFLLSREKDIDTFAKAGLFPTKQAIRIQRNRLELYPKGFPRGPTRQPRLSKRQSEERADSIGVGPVYTRLLMGLKRFSVEIHPTVADVAVVGATGNGKRRLTLMVIQLSSSQSQLGLRCAVRLGRLSKYFGIAAATMRGAFPMYEAVDQPDRRDGECGVGYFRNVAEVERFLEIVGSRRQPPPQDVSR